jgi:hypothetical protein
MRLGHSAERIADTIPCIYWDASETGIGFNPLKVSKGQEHLVAAQIVYSPNGKMRDEACHRNLIVDCERQICFWHSHAAGLDRAGYRDPGKTFMTAFCR